VYATTLKFYVIFQTNWITCLNLLLSVSIWITLVTSVSTPFGHSSTSLRSCGESIPIPLTGCSNRRRIVRFTSATVCTYTLANLQYVNHTYQNTSALNYKCWMLGVHWLLSCTDFCLPLLQYSGPTNSTEQRTYSEAQNSSAFY
jgi:hypothetical protein